MTAALHTDVVVAGGGPAGWAVAHALAVRSVEVVLVAPDPAERWSQTFGAWAAEVPDPEVIGRRFDHVSAFGRSEHTLRRPYVLLDNDALGARLRSASGVRTVSTFVSGVGSGPVRAGGAARREVRLGNGTSISARAVIDATGGSTSLVHRPARRTGVAVQAAYGVVARCSRPPVEADGCVLMDWRQPTRSGADDPTFCYVLDLGDGWYLVEETSLARSPAMSQGELRRRLARRLADRGIELQEVRREEIVAIPMDLAVPVAQPVIAFGAAGSLCHPATGYSVTTSLRLAPVLARAVADAISDGASAETLSQIGWETVWPTRRRRARALHDYGAAVLRGFDAEGSQAFFDAFFALPPEAWRRYVDPLSSVEELTGVMRQVFAEVPLGVKLRLMRGDPRLLAQALRR